MKTYTEEEVEDLLSTQKENCYTAIFAQTQDEGLLEKVLCAPEPGGWRKKKKHFAMIKCGIEYAPYIPTIDADFDMAKLFEFTNNLQFTPIDPTPKEDPTALVEISKETVDFLKMNCNVERESYGENTYILNNLRFKLIEADEKDI